MIEFITNTEVKHVTTAVQSPGGKKQPRAVLGFLFYILISITLLEGRL